MSTTLELQERVDRIERELGELKEFVMKPRQEPHPKAWMKSFGILKDNPDFRDVVRLGREYRESLPYPEGNPEGN